MKVHHGITHDHRIIGSGESPYQRICQSQDHDQEKERPDQADHRGFLNAFPDPVDAAGTEILADKGGVGTGNAGQRHVSDHDDPAGSRVGGNDGGSSVLMEPCRMTEPMEKIEFISPMENRWKRGH